MPNIKKGCIIELRYHIYSPYISNIDEFVFQADIPIKKLEAEFEAPEYFVYKSNAKGYFPIRPTTDKRRGNITSNSITRASGRSSGTSSFETQRVEYMKNVTSFELTDIPALKEEPYVNNINNYRSAVKYELSYVKYPHSPIDYYSTTWEDVVKNIYENSSFGSELNKTGYYEQDIDALIGSISDPVKRAYLIFDFVKSRMKWNEFHGYYTDKGVKKAYKEQIGNVAEINLMLTSMLRHAGLRAYPVLVSTRSHGVPLFPTREGYNYVISCVRFPEGDMLLDATNKFAVPNVLPLKALNWQGRMISEHGGSTLIDLYPKEKSKNNIFMMAQLHEDGNLEGGYRSMKTNHRALSFREGYIGTNLDDYLEKLENKYNGMEISDYQVKNDLDLAKPVTESYKFVKESQADIIGDKIYFSPMFFLRDTENPFKLEKRDYPVDFVYPSVTSYKIFIGIPEGYAVESVPEPGAFVMPDNLGVFKYNISSKGNKLQLAVESHISESVITPAYYQALKAYFSQLVEKQGEQIVLSKI
ncbi:transglutaminase [Pseudotamlana carrageenivorans]|nr:transglutaminase [Tamlana carrageenivorans]